MPNINDLKSSKFLTQNDVEPPVLATIKGYEQMNVAMENQAPEQKWCLHFHELEKPMVLNLTNGQLIAAITGSEELGDWIGKQVVLYNDKNVSFGTKITGGIRVRGRKNPIQKPVVDNLTNPDYVGDDPPPPTDDDIPY